MKDEEYLYLTKKIRDLLDIDLGGYKNHQMRRRLDAYIARAQVPEVVAYCKILERDKEVCQKLRDFLTINVSEFFRDAEQYEVLRTRILPELLKRNRKLNIWSAGCSNGAEPYSVAIILNELCQHQNYRIVATDIDTGILARANAGGPYIESDVRNVDKKLLIKHFVAEGQRYMVAEKIRRTVEFRQQNLLSDPFEKGFDLIVCRNVVIYFSDDAKSKLYRGFYDSLNENGMLFIGGTESMLGSSGLGFEKVCTSFHRKLPTDAMEQAEKGRVARLNVRDKESERIA